MPESKRITIRLGTLAKLVEAEAKKQGVTQSRFVLQAIADKLGVEVPAEYVGNMKIGKQAKKGAKARHRFKPSQTNP